MTQRKPSDVPIHTWVDRLIHEARERGEFDNLPGTGKPLPGIDRPLDEDWWIRQKLRDEDLPLDGLLPPALQLRKEVAALPDTVRDLSTEEEVRAAVREVNTRVAAFIRSPSGPAIPVAPANVDAVVAQWREAQPAEPPPPPPVATPPAPPRRRWWRRRTRRRE